MLSGTKGLYINSTKIVLDINPYDGINLYVNTDIWNLFLDGSNSNEGACPGCILKDP